MEGANNPDCWTVKAAVRIIDGYLKIYEGRT